MSERALARREIAPLEALEASTIEAVVATGNLAELSAAQRVHWYLMRCEAAGLDPRTQPFEYITFQGKLTLYPRKAATEQLAEKRGISLEILARGAVAGELYEAVIRATDAGGRYTDEIGLVSVQGKRGDDLANAMMKAVTKAKRRAILSLSGLGMLDETEIETIPDARPVRVDPQTGEVLPPTRPALAQGQVVDVSSRVSRAMETQSSYAGATIQGTPPETPEARLSRAAADLRAELEAQQIDPADKAFTSAYARRVLGRAPAPRSDPAAMAADIETVVADLRDRTTAMKAACASYSDTGADPNAAEGQTMRDDMERVLEVPVASRRDCTAGELRRFAEHCRREVVPEAEADPLGEPEAGE